MRELRQDADGLREWDGRAAEGAVLHQKIEV